MSDPRSLEEKDYYGTVQTWEGCTPHVALPLPQSYGMPRFHFGGAGQRPAVDRGQYVSVSGPNPHFPFEDDVYPRVPFWLRDAHVELILGRGDGALLHAPTEPASPTAFRGSAEAARAAFEKWPSREDDSRGDRLCIPPEWLRPIAEALLKMADHLESE